MLAAWTRRVAYVIAAACSASRHLRPACAAPPFSVAGSNWDDPTSYVAVPSETRALPPPCEALAAALRWQTSSWARGAASRRVKAARAAKAQRPWRELFCSPRRRVRPRRRRCSRPRWASRRHQCVASASGARCARAGTAPRWAGATLTPSRCHGSGAEEAVGPSYALRELSCACRGDLRLVHAQCAATWFTSRGAQSRAADSATEPQR